MPSAGWRSASPGALIGTAQLRSALTASASQGGCRRRALDGRCHAPASGACAVWPRAGVRGAARRAALTASAQGAVCGGTGGQRCARDAAAVAKRASRSLCGFGSRLARAAAAQLDSRRRRPRSASAVTAKQRLCCCCRRRCRFYAACERPQALLGEPGSCFCCCICVVRAFGGEQCTRSVAGVRICHLDTRRRSNCAAQRRRSPCCPCFCARRRQPCACGPYAVRRLRRPRRRICSVPAGLRRKRDPPSAPRCALRKQLA